MIWYVCLGLPLYYCCDCGYAIFVKHSLVNCPILLQVLHWYFFVGQLNPCACGESPHLVHWFGFLLYDCCCCGWLWLNPFVWVWFLTAFFLLGWQASAVVPQYIDLAPLCMFDVCCLMCLAVALLDSSF